MKKQLLGLLLLANSFIPSLLSSHLLCEAPTAAPVLRHQGKLYFNFVVSPSILTSSPGLKGTFQTFIITPDQRKFTGPKIKASAPSTAFEIIVEPPIVLGSYVIVVRNIDVKFK